MTDDWKRYEDYLVRTRYSVRDPETGEPLESSFDQMLENRIIPAITEAGTKGGVVSPHDLQSIAAAIRGRLIMPATPALMSLGNSRTRRPGYFSCYPMGPVEDSLDGIDAMKAKMRKIYVSGGGVGIDVSGLRPKGSLIDCGQGTASGPVSFLQDFDAVTGTTNQGGRRRGALLVQMDWHHPDIREFVTAKNLNGKLARLAKALPEEERPSQTGVLTNMNLSVNVFGGFWEDEGLIDLIARNMWESGDPGLLFTDNMLSHSPFRAEDDPRFSNPCGEFLAPAGLACNLITVNAAKLALEALNIRDFYEKLFYAGRLACILGNVILDMKQGYPLDEIRKKTQNMRPVGVGMSGFHAAILRQHYMPYGSIDSIRLAHTCQCLLTLGTLQGSLDGNRFNAPVYENHDFWNRHLHEMKLHDFFPYDPFTDIFRSPFERLAEFVEVYGGFPNCVTTSQPPTGSVSAFLHNLDTGIEPFFGPRVERRVRTPEGGWETFVLEPPEDVKRFLEGPEAHPTALNMDPDSQLEMLGAFQKYCHTGISKTVNLPASATVEDVKRLILKARDMRLKGFTVYRDGSLDGVLTVRAEKSPEPAVPAPAAPYDLDGDRPAYIFKAEGQSLSAHVTLAHDPDNEIREVFIAAGTLGADVNSLFAAIGMILSVSLQHDPALFAPLVKVLCKVRMDQRFRINMPGGPPVIGTSLPHAIGLLMETHRARLEGASPPEPQGGYDLCPECHELSLKRSGSCNKCLSCGYSSC
ncbi:MAG: hypothetical protein LBW85_14530 [Deltaproteobacteria bacterium]|nr:hypothetical protein [Deltaproteobacteria bacterium]